MCQLGFSQVDMLNIGLKSCLEDKEFEYINELFTELEDFVFEDSDVSPSDYEIFVENFCKLESHENFLLPENSRLTDLIKKGISSKFWIFEEFEPSNKYVVDGEEIEIVPPGQTEYVPPPYESIEKTYINSNSNYISCSKDYVFHQAMNAYYQRYDTYKVASSSTKLCSMTEFITENDYKLLSIKHYVLIHCVCQKIIHENDYYRFFH